MLANVGKRYVNLGLSSIVKQKVGLPDIIILTSLPLLRHNHVRYFAKMFIFCGSIVNIRQQFET
jgi:hypothetical protein